jgi:hypothetical protein
MVNIIVSERQNQYLSPVRLIFASLDILDYVHNCLSRYMAHYLLKCLQNTANLHKGQKHLKYICVYHKKQITFRGYSCIKMFIITYTEINKHILLDSENYSNATQCANGNV